MKRTLIFSLLACAPMILQAADLPNIVNQNKAHNQQMCIDRAASDCVNTICPNSPALNCTDNCQKSAQDKCKEMTEE